MVGVIRLLKDVPTNVQNFTVTSGGELKFFDIGKPKIFAKSGRLYITTGILNLEFNEAPGRHDLTISYEFNMELNDQ